MADVESFEEMVGTREAAATESGRAMATESGGAATTDDATAGDEAAATGGIMYADEGPYTIDVRHVEAMVGTTREAADGNKSPAGTRRRRDQGRDRRSRDETHGHVMQQIIKILFTNRFSQFLLKKIQQ